MGTEIINIDTTFGNVVVERRFIDSYYVLVNGESKHGRRRPEDVIRVLAHYLMSASYKISKMS